MNFGIRKIEATRAAGFARSSDHSLIEQDHSPVAKTGNLIHRKTCFQVSADAGERVFAMGGEMVVCRVETCSGGQLGNARRQVAPYAVNGISTIAFRFPSLMPHDQ